MFALVLISIFAGPSFGNVYYDDDGSILTGDSLIEMCYDNQVCNTHFAKNVYASSRPVLDHEWTPLLFPEFYDQFDSESVCGSGSKFIDMDTCAQVHSPMTTYHAEGKVPVSYVEEQYSLKWANIRNSKEIIYDSFLDNSVAYWTDDLAKYDSLWTELGADIVYLRWYVKDGDKLSNNGITSKTYYSLITHNGDKSTGSTLTQYELISDTFSGLTDEIILSKFIDSEQRVFFDDETDYRTFSTGCETVPIGARRAVSSVDDNVEWYSKIFSASIVDTTKQVIVDEYIDYNGNPVKYAHIKLYPSEESTTISFFERDLISSTYGDFSVLDFENVMTNTHNENMITPFCGIDRWFDMHYAIDFDDVTMSEKVFTTMMNSGEKYTVYEEWAVSGNDGTYPTFVYMTEPNGHSVQLVFNLDEQIEFLTNPQQWDADWCPLECTNEMKGWNYGDQIALVHIEGDDDDDDDEDDTDLLSDAFIRTATQQNKESIFSLIIGILGVFGILSIALMIAFYAKSSNKFPYKQIPQ